MKQAHESFLKATRRAFMIPGMIWPREMSALSTLFSQSRRHAEIGVFCGKSLYVTAAAMSIFGPPRSDKMIVAVDNFSERLSNGLDMVPGLRWWRSVLDATIEVIRTEFSVQVRLIDAPSTHAALMLADDPSFESVYIDANHAEEYVFQDISSWWSLLTDGGIMAGHDYSAECPGTRNAVNGMFGSHFTVMPDTRIWSVTRDQATDGAVCECQNSI